MRHDNASHTVVKKVLNVPAKMTSDRQGFSDVPRERTHARGL